MTRALQKGALSGLLVLAVLGQGGASPLMLLVLHLALLLLVLGTLAQPTRSGLAAGPLAVWALFLCVVAAGAILAPYGYAAYLVLVELAASFAVALLAARVGPALLPELGTALACGGAALGLLALYQRHVLGTLRPAGTFLNPNHLGAWLVVALVLGLGAWKERPGRAQLLLRGVIVLPAALGILLCGSRGALVAAGAAALFLALAVGGRLQRAQRVAVLGAAALLVVLAAGGILLLAARRQDPFAYHRLRIWEASLHALEHAPWSGTGPGQFKSVAANLDFPLPDRTLRYEKFFVSPHSDLLRVACELGWPGVLAFALALTLAAAEIGRRLARRLLPPAALAAAAGLVGLLAQAAVDDLSDRPALYLLAAALAGSLLATERRIAASPPLALRLAAAALAGSLFLVGELSPFLALDALSPSLARGPFNTREDLPRGRLTPAQHERLRAALVRNPVHPDGYLREAEHLAGDGSDWSALDYASAREAAEHAVRLEPQDARYRLGLARIERLACITLFRDEASRARTASAYAEAQERARHDPFLPLEEGHFLLETGDAAGAGYQAERVLAIEPEAVPARLLLAESILAAGEAGARERARELVHEAEEIAARCATTPKETPYARALLTLEPRWREALRARVDSGAATP